MTELGPNDVLLIAAVDTDQDVEFYLWRDKNQAQWEASDYEDTWDFLSSLDQESDTPEIWSFSDYSALQTYLEFHGLEVVAVEGCIKY